MARVSFIVAIVLACAACVGASCSCPGDFSPVQTSEGLWMLNACVARCSGVSVISNGAGKAAPSAQSAGRPVSAEVLRAHAAQGFRFIDFARVARFTPAQAQDAAVSAPRLNSLPTDRVVRFDVAHGALYATAAPARLPELGAAVDYAAKAAPAQQQQQQQQQGRKLRFVQQHDERIAVTAAPSGLPEAAVGQLLSYGQKWHCSAALIGERTVVTAAHCVFDRASGAFARALYFVPGRFRSVEGKVVAPFGSAEVAEVFVMSAFVAGSAEEALGADIAIVRLADNAKVGAAVGHLGVAVPAAGESGAVAVGPAADVTRVRPTSASGRRLMARTGADAAPAAWTGSLWTAGYPADRAEGTLVTSKCGAQQQLVSGAAGATIRLDCSTQLGQSGSPLVNAGGQVRGVVAFEVAGASGYNGGTAITAFLWANLIKPHLL